MSESDLPLANGRESKSRPKKQKFIAPQHAPHHPPARPADPGARPGALNLRPPRCPKPAPVPRPSPLSACLRACDDEEASAKVDILTSTHGCRFRGGEAPVGRLPFLFLFLFLPEAERFSCRACMYQCLLLHRRFEQVLRTLSSSTSSRKHLLSRFPIKPQT